MLEFPEAPEPFSGFPYSNVVVAGGLVAIASQVPFDDNHHLVGTEFGPQAHQVLANLRRCPELARPDLFADYNHVDTQYFIPPYPARTTVACSLVVPGMLIQLDALAWRPSTP